MITQEKLLVFKIKSEMRIIKLKMARAEAEKAAMQKSVDATVTQTAPIVPQAPGVLPNNLQGGM